MKIIDHHMHRTLLKLICRYSNKKRENISSIVGQSMALLHTNCIGVLPQYSAPNMKVSSLVQTLWITERDHFYTFIKITVQ